MFQCFNTRIIFQDVVVNEERLTYLRQVPSPFNYKHSYTNVSTATPSEGGKKKTRGSVFELGGSLGARSPVAGRQYLGRRASYRLCWSPADTKIASLSSIRSDEWCRPSVACVRSQEGLFSGPRRTDTMTTTTTTSTPDAGIIRDLHEFEAIGR